MYRGMDDSGSDSRDGHARIYLTEGEYERLETLLESREEQFWRNGVQVPITQATDDELDGTVDFLNPSMGIAEDNQEARIAAREIRRRRGEYFTEEERDGLRFLLGCPGTARKHTHFYQGTPLEVDSSAEDCWFCYQERRVATGAARTDGRG